MVREERVPIRIFDVGQPATRLICGKKSIRELKQRQARDGQLTLLKEIGSWA